METKITNKLYWIIGILLSIVAIVAGYYFLWKPVGWRKKPTIKGGAEPSSYAPNGNAQTGNVNTGNVNTGNVNTGGSNNNSGSNVTVNTNEPGGVKSLYDVYVANKSKSSNNCDRAMTALLQYSINIVCKKQGISALPSPYSYTKSIPIDGERGPKTSGGLRQVGSVIGVDIQNSVGISTFFNKTVAYLSGTSSVDENGIKAAFAKIDSATRNKILSYAK